MRVVTVASRNVSFFLRERERCRKCAGSFNNSSLVCGLACAVFTLYTTTAAYYIVHIRQLGPCNVTLKFQPLGSLVWSVCLSFVLPTTLPYCTSIVV